MRVVATPDTLEVQLCQIDRDTVMPYVAFGDIDPDEAPIGLIPGLGQTEQHWGEYPDALGGRVYTFGLPTDENGNPAAHSLGRFASLTAQGMRQVLEQDGYQEPDIHIGGLSWGGFLAAQIALDHTDMVNSMHLMSTWPANMHVPWRGWPKLTTMLALNAKDRKGHDPAGLYGGLYRTDPERARAEFGWLADRDIDPRQPKAQKRAVRSSVGSLAFRMTLRALSGNLPPALVIASDDDPIVPLVVAADSARGMGMDLHIVKDGGHASPITHFHEVAPVVSAFRKRVRNRSAAAAA